MAEVLEELDKHRPDHREYEGGWWELACAGCDFAKGQRLSHLDWAPYRIHRAEVFADALTAAGYGPVQAVAVIHVAHDAEAHARSFNEGYETAMAQELADDPTTAQDWLDAKLKAAGAQALRDAADDFEDNMGVGEFDEWARRDGKRWGHIEEAWEHQGPYMDWLRARADSLDAP